MRKKLNGILILSLCTVSLSGCIYLRQAGPCYGVGCPALAHGQAPQPAVNASTIAPKTQSHAKNRPASLQQTSQGK
jgi:hypothetical protein